MDVRAAPEPPVAWQGLLGYLNFSDGRPDPRFQGQFHAACRQAQSANVSVVDLLDGQLTELQNSGSSAFRDVGQARAVIAALRDLPAAYRSHHRDLLELVDDQTLFAPLFLARACEAILAARAQGDGDLVADAIQRLNDFVGYRPIPTLETRREGEIYDRERFRPTPLYLRGVGVSAGPYQSLILRALEVLRSTDPDLLEEAQFDPAVLDELALDPRAYDHNHPANRRPNHIFGEWDPHVIDNQGRYRRFVIRRNTIEALRRRVAVEPDPNGARIAEAGGVLAGTVLMAAALCGRGPTAYSTNSTLSTLVPAIARLRDRYYESLLKQTTGPAGDQLRRESEAARQPFGAARQQLNQMMAHDRALQLQEQHLASVFAELGYPAESKRRALAIATASVRIESAIRSRVTAAAIAADRGDPDRSFEDLREAVDLMHRGIRCGALADPWSILGFQGLYPLFLSREDSIHDPRVEELLELVGDVFDGYARALSEAASLGNAALRRELAAAVNELAEWWDRFATYEVGDLPRVHGAEAAAAAEHVATALSQLRQLDSGTPDLAFWRQHLDGFRTPAAFARVVTVLLDRGDLTASQGLLMAWLGQASEVPLEAGDDSFHTLIRRWMTETLRSASLPENRAKLARFFEALEANAEGLWHVPELSSDFPAPDDANDDDDDVYGAAYEGVTFKDSADDGTEGALAGDGPASDGFLLEGQDDLLRSRLQFLATLATLWRAAAPSFRDAPTVLGDWLVAVRQREAGLSDFMDRLHAVNVPQPHPGFEGAVEYDRRRGIKEQLIEEAIGAGLAFGQARRTLAGLVGGGGAVAEWEPAAVEVERGIESADPVAVRSALGGLLSRLHSQPLLYVPLTAGGHPKHILRTRSAQALLTFLLERLPRLGLLCEAFDVMQMARRMEQTSPPEGKKVTEFDRLFPVGLQASIEAVIDLADSTGKPADRDMQEVLRRLVAPYLAAWVEHSGTLRLSVMENVASETEWERVTAFVRTYGRMLFTPSFLHLANVRAVLHRGVEEWLDELPQQDDAPEAFLEALDGELPRAQAVRHLEFVLTAVGENYDEYRDYNTTTTQSDYGENLSVLLDFLRVKAAYERDLWRLRPLFVVHETLCRRGRPNDAAAWQEGIAAETRGMADKHLAELARVELRHAVKLRTARDRVGERFVASLAADRLSALVEPAWDAARAGSDESNPAFAKLLAEVEAFAATPAGVGLDVPPWLRRLEREVHRLQHEPKPVPVPIGRLTYESLREQVNRSWDKPGELPEPS
ncbi:MAG: hypothetical protein U0746_02430 [Gemmataceae bacterium]